MDINKLLKNVNSLNEYISVSQDFSNKCKNSKVQINITIVLSLKKIRSYEIEYFNKCEENGLACAILERMLCLPPSKTWGVLAKELVNMLQYWLDAIRKHLISHSLNWWTFLKMLLKFIKEIRLKDSSIPNMLVEQTAECLLDLATNERPDAFQRHEILYCLNMYCAESNREIRFALRNKFTEYFVKMSMYMATCGHFPCQYGTLETLLRWLLPRQDRALRLAAANEWFPHRLYGTRAVDVFLERPWQNFFQDARDFLNALNDKSDLVTSVVCRKLSVGKTIIISGKEKQESWLDINSGGRCISVLVGAAPLETLFITEENTHSARLYREQRATAISLSTLHPLDVRPSAIEIPDDDIHDVTIIISSRTDIRRLDVTLRRVFGDKYQLLLDVDTEFTPSPVRLFAIFKKNSSEGDTRFSHPVEAKRRGHSGYIAKARTLVSCKSPSTASTSSLAHLHDKLAALPRYKYDKEPVAICAMPELSVVNELSETDDRQSFNTTTSTLKFTRYGIYNRNIKTRVENTSRKSQSDGESAKGKVKLGRCLSPVVNDEHSASLLFIATVGSTDDSIINDTVERLSKIEDFNENNTADLLIHEALQAELIANENEKLLDSGINTGENRNTQNIHAENSEAIENTCEENTKDSKKVSRNKTCTIISKSTSGDESNTEVVLETPINNINTRRRNLFKNKNKESKFQSVNFDEIKNQPLAVVEKHTFSIKEVEDFFTQNITETKAGDILISPNLAKKINETSSESSENFDEQYNDQYLKLGQKKVYNIDIIECLNSMLDRVCKDLDKYTEYLNKEDILEFDYNETGIIDNIERPKNEILLKEIEQKPKKNMKLKHKTVTKKEKLKTRVTKKRKNKLELESTSKMSTIIEINDDLNVEGNDNKKIITTNDKTPENTKRNSTATKSIETATRRKRKLYSPKDDQIENAKQFTNFVDTDEENTVLSEIKTYKRLRTPKSSAACYKEIEKERQKHIRLPRSRRSKPYIVESPSPRTLKMNAVFDKLKGTANSNEKITLANKTSTEANVYNFTSDSEDEDFKKKKIALQKRASSTTANSFESAVSTRYGRMRNRVNYSENNDETNKKKNTRRNRVTRQTKKRKVNIKVDNLETLIDLEDERMRETIPETLNTSIVAETCTNIVPAEPKLMLQKRPQMEPIDDYVHKQSSDTLPSKKNNVNRKNKKIDATLSLKKEKGSSSKDALTILPRNEDDRTESPLPGLVVESVPTNKDEATDSFTVNMLKKCKKYYEEGPDVINDSIVTQNMLSDVEKTNYTSKNVQNLCLTEEIYCVNDSDLDIRATQFKDSKRKSRKNQKPLRKRLNKSKKNAQSVKDSNQDDMNEILSITEFGDAISEKSIATVGITGHGDIEESPPNLGMIKQTLQPRGLELEDLDQSMKDYFVKLTREINEHVSEDKLPNEHSNSNNTAELRDVYDNINVKNKTLKVTKSPVVSLKRLPLEDISKWLPSRRNSDSDQSSANSGFNLVQKENKKPNDTEKSPIVHIAKLSFEEFNKWLPMPDNLGFKDNFEEVVSVVQRESSKSSLKLVYKKDNKSPSVNDSPLFKDEDTPNQNITVLKLVFPDNVLKSDKSCSPKSINDNSVKKVKAKQTIISPIKSCHDFPSKRSDKAQSEYEDYIEHIKNRFSYKETKEHLEEKSSKRRMESPIIERQDTIDTKDSPKSTSTRIEDSISRAVKRISSPILRESKKTKIELNKTQAVTISESGPSVSSVNDWFKTIESSRTRAEGINLSFRDSIQTVMEKLDTTLVEINRNTSKEFVNLFVDAQKYLAEQKDKRRKMYKSVASDILGDVVKIMDNKFADLDKRSQDLENDFMEQLKDRAFKLIRDDCKQKRAMVLLLKEDVQAVMDHIDGKGRTKSD